jgi:hypothetical protein
MEMIKNVGLTDIEGFVCLSTEGVSSLGLFAFWSIWRFGIREILKYKKDMGKSSQVRKKKN